MNTIQYTIYVNLSFDTFLYKFYNAEIIAIVKKLKEKLADESDEKIIAIAKKSGDEEIKKTRQKAILWQLYYCA